MDIRFDQITPRWFDKFHVSQIAPDTFLDGQSGVDFVVVPADSTTEVHRHLHSDNVIYVIRGSGVVILDGREHEIGPGMRVVIPKSVCHGFRTAGQSLEFVSVQLPPILDERHHIFDRELC